MARPAAREFTITTTAAPGAAPVAGGIPTGREFAVKVTAAATADSAEPSSRFEIVIDGKARTVDARRLRAGTWSIVLDGGRAQIVDLDVRGKQGTALSAGLVEALVTIEDSAKKKLRQAASAGRPTVSGEKVAAPIAGKVVKILVAIGDVVAPGHAVAVLEAMKMENELLAERGGTVSAINKQAGQAVDTGDVLIELK